MSTHLSFLEILIILAALAIVSAVAIYMRQFMCSVVDFAGAGGC